VAEVDESLDVIVEREVGVEATVGVCCEDMVEERDI
jgi:hypothetical protein